MLQKEERRDRALGWQRTSEVIWSTTPLGLNPVCKPNKQPPATVHILPVPGNSLLPEAAPSSAGLPPPGRQRAAPKPHPRFQSWSLDPPSKKPKAPEPSQQWPCPDLKKGLQARLPLPQAISRSMSTTTSHLLMALTFSMCPN